MYSGAVSIRQCPSVIHLCLQQDQIPVGFLLRLFASEDLAELSFFR